MRRLWCDYSLGIVLFVLFAASWIVQFLQLFSMVLLTPYLVYKGSTESKDGQERMQDSLDRIERRIRQLESAQYRNPAKRVVDGRLLAD